VVKLMDVVKDWIELLSALLIPILVVVATIIAIQQWRINQKRLKHELFDRRYEVYQSITEFIAKILTTGKVESNSSIRLLADTKKVYFLFDKDTHDFIMQLYRKSIDLDTLDTILEVTTEKDKREKNLKNQGELKDWFSKQLKIVEKRFEKFLRLTH